MNENNRYGENAAMAFQIIKVFLHFYLVSNEIKINVQYLITTIVYGMRLLKTENYFINFIDNANFPMYFIEEIVDYY